MSWRCIQYVWRVLGCLVLVMACRANHMYRTVMLLKSGSTNHFDTMWNTNGAINDPNGNKSLIPIEELASSADFKVDIDPAWGSITDLEIIGYNALGEELFYAWFDVAGQNISQVSHWFVTANLMHASIDMTDPSTVVRDDDKELLFLTNSNEVWFSILHPGSGTDPKIVMAVNSSASLTVGSIVSDIVNEGCWANWELSLTLSYTDMSHLTVDGCILSCSSNYVALQLAKNCFCGDFISQSSPVAHMCTEACPGDDSYVCGGTNDGFYSVYSATLTASELDSLPAEADSVPLLTLTYSGGYIQTINVGDELLSQGWTDVYIFIDKISVNATNSTGHAMLFSFEYLYDSMDTYIQYEDAGSYFFDTDGYPVDIHILKVESLRITHEWDVAQATLQLYGPTANSYVDVPMIVVYAEIADTLSTTTPVSTTDSGTATTEVFGSTTDYVTTTESPTDSVTTSESPTASVTPTESPTDSVTATESPTDSVTTTETPTDSVTTTESPTDSVTATESPTDSVTTTETPTDSVTTTESPSTTTSVVASLYLLYPNMSVSVNGTLYCPCNETNNITSTPNLTSIYTDSNKTFEELIADLTLDADTLSSNTRRYTSASDDRASSATLGSLGLIIIVSSFSFVVYLDSARLVLEASKIKKKYKILKKRLSRRSLRIQSIHVEPKEDGQNIPDILK